MNLNTLLDYYFKQDNIEARKIFITFQSYIVALAVFPFSIWRFYQGDYSHAIADSALILTLIFFGQTARSCTKISYLAWFYSSLYVLFTLYILNISGKDILFWVFPAAISMHFLLRSNEALFMNFVLLAGILLTPLDISLYGFITFVLTYIITILLTAQFSSRLKSDNRSLKNLSEVDCLTQTGNRRALNKKILEIIHSNSSKQAQCLMVLDIDHFKSLNDTYGHQTGDQALINLAIAIRNHFNANASVYRYGGEEFVILVSTSLSLAQKQAEDLRKIVASTHLIQEQLITVSIGIAQLSCNEQPDDWVKKADQALYNAKTGGRNQVKIYS